MIWGKTTEDLVKETELLKCKIRVMPYRKWFAWYPVVLDDGRGVWFHWIEYKPKMFSTYTIMPKWYEWSYHYREIVK